MKAKHEKSTQVGTLEKLLKFPKFILENWVEADKMRLIINEMPKEKLHGNIFVKNS